MLVKTGLFYEVVGDAGPHMLMMHGGLGLDHTYLRPWHDELARDARLVYYDHRGNGRSARGGHADHATWQADAASLLVHLGEERAIVFGHSYGSWLALGFALRFPARVEALVLCGAAPAFDYLDVLAATLATKDPDLVAAFDTAITGGAADDDAFGDLWIRILPLYFHHYQSAYADAFDGTRYSAHGYQLGAACMASYNLADRLGELRVPVLIVQGRHDFITPIAQARRIAAAVPNAKVVELSASGHFPFLEENRAYVAAIRGWLREHGR